MSDDAINWVTVKIPEMVRDDAQDDPRTYAEIMRAGLDSDGAGEIDNSLEQLYTDIINTQDKTINELQRQRDILEQVLRAVDAGEVDPDGMSGQLDRIESAAKEATNAAQQTQKEIEELQ